MYIQVKKHETVNQNSYVSLILQNICTQILPFPYSVIFCRKTFMYMSYSGSNRKCCVFLSLNRKVIKGNTSRTLEQQ